MKPTDLWPTSLRIIEIGATSGSLAQSFVAWGYDKLLAVVTSGRQRPMADLPHALRSRLFAAARSPRVVQQNNADVLILRGASALHVGRIRAVRHAQWVALKVEPTPASCLAFQFAIAQCVVRRFDWPRVVNIGRGESLVAFRVRKPRPHQGVRRFVPHRLGLSMFLKSLETRRLGHAVLRWFDTLPQVAPGEDVDLLVADVDLEEVRTLLDSSPGIQPVDLYSVTGLPGADFRNMPYYPPYAAEELLARAICKRDLCRVPAPREHFLSMAYHALYHKGEASGVPRRGKAVQQCASKAEHNYPQVLKQLAVRIGAKVDITLEDLDAYLDSQGWRPPHDMLIRLSKKNRWVRTLLSHAPKGEAADDGTAVFLLRQVALERGGVERAKQVIAKHGFEVVSTHEFDSRTSAMVARSVRGGNWGPGPWPISGGPPVAAIVVRDPSPMAPTRKQRKHFPFLANARLLCKEQIRDAFNEGVPSEQHCNVIHSSDNGREAMDYLRVIMPESTAAKTNDGPPQQAKAA